MRNLIRNLLVALAFWLPNCVSLSLVNSTSNNVTPVQTKKQEQVVEHKPEDEYLVVPARNDTLRIRKSEFPNVELYKADHAIATCIYLPQIHKSPLYSYEVIRWPSTDSTEYLSTKAAIKCQKNLDSIISKLHANLGLSYIFVEGFETEEGIAERKQVAKKNIAKLDSLVEEADRMLTVLEKNREVVPPKYWKYINFMKEKIKENASIIEDIFYLYFGGDVLAAVKNPQIKLLPAEEGKVNDEAFNSLREYIEWKNRKDFFFEVLKSKDLMILCTADSLALAGDSARAESILTYHLSDYLGESCKGASIRSKIINAYYQLVRFFGKLSLMPLVIAEMLAHLYKFDTVWSDNFSDNFEYMFLRMFISDIEDWRLFKEMEDPFYCPPPDKREKGKLYPCDVDNYVCGLYKILKILNPVTVSRDIEERLKEIESSKEKIEESADWLIKSSEEFFKSNPNASLVDLMKYLGLELKLNLFESPLEYYHFAIDKRDSVLVEKIKEFLNSHSTSVFGVVYGAAHTGDLISKLLRDSINVVVIDAKQD